MGGQLARARLGVHRGGEEADPVSHVHPVLHGRRFLRGAVAPEGTSLIEARETIAYYAGQGSVNIRNGTCRRARQFTERAFMTTETASAMSTILHETLHRQGLHDERITECFANDAIKYAGWLAHWNSLAKQNDATWTASEGEGLEGARPGLRRLETVDRPGVPDAQGRVPPAHAVVLVGPSTGIRRRRLARRPEIHTQRQRREGRRHGTMAP